VDAVVYGFQKYGGVNTYFSEILQRISRRRDSRVDLLLPPKVVGKLPTGRIGRLRRHVFQGSFVNYAAYWPAPHTDWVISWLFPESSAYSNGFTPRTRQLFRNIAELIDDRVLCQRLRLTRRTVFQSTYFTLPDIPVPQIATALDLNHELLPEYYDNQLGKWLRSIIRRNIGGATRVVAISETTKRHLCCTYQVPESRVDVVYPGVEPADFYPENDTAFLDALKTKYDLGRPYILFVGHREGFKNFSCLLAAFAEHGFHKSHDLVAVGPPWSEEELVEYAKFKVWGRVRNIVFPPLEDLRGLYSLASVFVYPSRGEGFGIPLLEALMVGVPILASDIEVFREVSGETAAYFDPASPHKLAEQLERTLEAGNRHDLAALGRERAGVFSWDEAALKMREIYEKALADFES
jgi:glycosyltransferase involved in cell wall biosynthesis